MNQMTETSQQRPAARPPLAVGGRIPRVAVISARWHADVVDQATQSFRRAMLAAGLTERQLEWHEVPGAFEIPLRAQELARLGEVDAIVACALVVNGGIYRHEFVASAVIDGLMRVQLDEGLPVLSVVLTPRDFHEHDTHREFFHQHFVKKGEEAAAACLAMLSHQALRKAA